MTPPVVSSPDRHASGELKPGELGVPPDTIPEFRCIATELIISDMKWLKKLGVTREALAWAFYDWANSAYATVVIAAVLPAYYASYVASELPRHMRTAYWGYTNFIATALIAIVAPIIGGISDRSASRKRFWIGFAFLGIVATALMYLIDKGDYVMASALFIVSMFGFGAANVFYDSFLLQVSTPETSDFVSNLGFALGYVGGGLLLAFELFMIKKPAMFGLRNSVQAIKIGFVLVAVWWLVFSLPSWLILKEEKEEHHVSIREAAIDGIANFVRIFQEVVKIKNVLIFLIAYWLYNDGISTIIKMSVVYGSEIGIGKNDLILAILLVQFVAAPFAILFGVITRYISTKKALFITLGVYSLITVFAYFMKNARDFLILAFMVATVQGGAQALSRSLFSRLIPREKRAEFFGFFSLSGKFASIIGPLLVAVVTQLTGTGRNGILILLVLFIAGGITLGFVKES